MSPMTDSVMLETFQRETLAPFCFLDTCAAHVKTFRLQYG